MGHNGFSGCALTTHHNISFGFWLLLLPLQWCMRFMDQPLDLLMSKKCATNSLSKMHENFSVLICSFNWKNSTPEKDLPWGISSKEEISLSCRVEKAPKTGCPEHAFSTHISGNRFTARGLFFPFKPWFEPWLAASQQEDIPPHSWCVCHVSI